MYIFVAKNVDNRVECISVSTDSDGDRKYLSNN